MQTTNNFMLNHFSQISAAWWSHARWGNASQPVHDHGIDVNATNILKEKNAIKVRYFTRLSFVFVLWRPYGARLFEQNPRKKKHK